MKTLETERLVLRDMTFDDAEDLYNILEDEETAYWFGTTSMDERWEACRMIERGSSYQYGIARKEDNKIIGVLQIYNKHFWSSALHLGYVLSSEARGNHYMKEAVDAVCEHIFEDTDTNCIMLDIRSDNGPSRAVAESCGFTLNEEISDWEKDINFYDYPLDEFYKVRVTKATNRLGDFLPEGAFSKLYARNMAA